MNEVIRDGQLNFRVSPVFVRNYQATQPIVINQGGTRSGKTYSILQRLIVYAFQNTGKIIDIVRKTQAELRASVLTDFIEILKNTNLYTDRMHNKTNAEFYINGNVIRFLGLDKAQKRRGSKRDLLYINEANGITLEDWIQLNIRLTGQVYLDFNPSEYFWLNEHILEKRNDFEFIKSTYKDNYDFLEPKQIREIERLIEIDDYYYQVYVLGNLATMKGKIYNNYGFVGRHEYDLIDADEVYYGVDWGYEHNMVLMEVKLAQETVYERCLYMEQYKYDTDLINWMLERDISQAADIYADHAYPASIKRMREAGFNVRKADKDVQPGIRFCQGLKRMICNDEVSQKYIKQINKYKWKQTADGTILTEPVKVDDDACDASRYANYTHLKRKIE
jgi:phage terminase large subunit